MLESWECLNTITQFKNPKDVNDQHYIGILI